MWVRVPPPLLSQSPANSAENVAAGKRSAVPSEAFYIFLTIPGLGSERLSRSGGMSSCARQPMLRSLGRCLRRRVSARNASKRRGDSVFGKFEGVRQGLVRRQGSPVGPGRVPALLTQLTLCQSAVVLVDCQVRAEVVKRGSET